MMGGILSRKEKKIPILPSLSRPLFFLPLLFFPPSFFNPALPIPALYMYPALDVSMDDTMDVEGAVVVVLLHLQQVLQLSLLGRLLHRLAAPSYAQICKGS